MKTIRIKLSDQSEEILEEIRLQLNCNWQTAANVAILNGRNAVGSGISAPRSGKSGSENAKSGTEMPLGEASSLYIYNNNNNNSSYSKGKLIPSDFDPPVSITDEAGLDREGAIFQFKKWAGAKKKRFPCWDEAFRYACNNWLKHANKHLILKSESWRTDGLNFDVTTKHPEDDDSDAEEIY